MLNAKLIKYNRMCKNWVWGNIFYEIVNQWEFKYFSCLRNAMVYTKLILNGNLVLKSWHVKRYWIEWKCAFANK